MNAGTLKHAIIRIFWAPSTSLDNVHTHTHKKKQTHTHHALENLRPFPVYTVGICTHKKNATICMLATERIDSIIGSEQ